MEPFSVKKLILHVLLLHTAKHKPKKKKILLSAFQHKPFSPLSFAFILSVGLQGRHAFIYRLQEPYNWCPHNAQVCSLLSKTSGGIFFHPTQVCLTSMETNLLSPSDPPGRIQINLEHKLQRTSGSEGGVLRSSDKKLLWDSAFIWGCYWGVLCLLHPTKEKNVCSKLTRAATAALTFLPPLMCTLHVCLKNWEKIYSTLRQLYSRSSYTQASGRHLIHHCEHLYLCAGVAAITPLKHLAVSAPLRLTFFVYYTMATEALG